MKKLLLVLFFLCSPGLLYAFDFLNHEIVIEKNIGLVFETKNEDSQTLNYKITLKYPQLAGESLSSAAQYFNEKMNQFTNSEMIEFENKVSDNQAEAKKLPVSAQQNYFNLNFNASIFKANGTILIGLRFNKEYFYAGNAHPAHDIEVYNYNLTTGKELQLGDLFIPDSKYLKMIADYCRVELTKRLKAQKVKLFPEGLAPKADNFINWNLEPDGLLFTFDEAQVAPYDAGQPEVFISYKTLKPVLSPDAPIMTCLKNPKSCIAV